MDLALAHTDGEFDLVIDPDTQDLVIDDEGIESALIVSFFTDQRAVEVEPPRNQDDRKGWWIDSYYPQRDPTGSLIWTLKMKDIESERALAEYYANESAHWMIDQSIVGQLAVQASHAGSALLLKTTYVRSGEREQEYIEWRI